MRPCLSIFPCAIFKKKFSAIGQEPTLGFLAMCVAESAMYHDKYGVKLHCNQFTQYLAFFKSQHVVQYGVIFLKNRQPVPIVQQRFRGSVPLKM